MLAVEQQTQGITLVLEGRRGQELGELLAARGRFGTPEFLDLACGMTAAIRDLHQHDILHGAVRPASFLVDDTGGVRLAEYGFDARMTREDVEH